MKPAFKHDFCFNSGSAKSQENASSFELQMKKIKPRKVNTPQYDEWNGTNFWILDLS